MKLSVWHIIKFVQTDPLTGDQLMVDSLHVQPLQSDKHGHPIPGHFDTTLINDGTGGDHGSNGIFLCYSKCSSLLLMPDYEHRLSHWTYSCRLCNTQKASPHHLRTQGISTASQGLCQVVFRP